MAPGATDDLTVLRERVHSPFAAAVGCVISRTTRTAASVTPMTEGQGYRTVQTSTLDSNGARVIRTTGYAANGDKAFVMVQTTSADGLTVTNTYDTDGDGVVDQIQTAVTVINPTTQARTETLTNLRGADAATAVLLSRTVTITSADGKSVTVKHDHAGGGWFDQVETRVTNPDGSRLVTITDQAQNGTMIAQSSETISANGLTRVRAIDTDGDGDTDVVVTETIGSLSGGRTESVVTRKSSATTLPLAQLNIAKPESSRGVDRMSHSRKHREIAKHVLNNELFRGICATSAYLLSAAPLLAADYCISGEVIRMEFAESVEFHIKDFPPAYFKAQKACDGYSSCSDLVLFSTNTGQPVSDALPTDLQPLCTSLQILQEFIGITDGQEIEDVDDDSLAFIYKKTYRISGANDRWVELQKETTTTRDGGPQLGGWESDDSGGFAGIFEITEYGIMGK